MATTLANLRSQVRIELRDPDGITFQDADIDYAINQAYRKAYLRVTNRNQDYFITTVDIDVVAYQREYPLPSDFLRLKMLEIRVGGVTRPLRRRRRGISVNITSGSVFNVGRTDLLFDFEGANLVVEPTPAFSDTDALKMTYYPTVASLSAPTDAIHAEFKDMWVDVITLDAAKSCLSQIEATGGYVATNDIRERLKEVRDTMDDSIAVRSISPQIVRKRRFFQ